ncbi:MULTISPECIES: hypothetical protein [unclassified Microbacterium]|uniref:hypothetical protein n=1 Tax=unclassified Microbacterium TaxID=2609290 RepID=UPI0038697898
MDARIPERYLMDRRIVRLSASARASYFMATLWAVSNRTDGRIERDDIALIPTFDAASVDALVDAELWNVGDGDTWIIADYLSTQTSRADFEVLENARRADREKKRRQRAAKSANESPGASPGHVPRDSTGEARRGEASSSEVSISETRETRDDGIVEAEIVEVDYFDTAWQSWPKRERRVEAEAAFEDAAKRHPRGPRGLADDIVAHGAAYVGGDWATPEAMRYVPGLVGWLTSSRWADDLPTPRRERKTQSERNAEAFARYLGAEGEAS